MYTFTHMRTNTFKTVKKGLAAIMSLANATSDWANVGGRFAYKGTDINDQFFETSRNVSRDVETDMKRK